MNGVSERGARGESLTKNLETLRTNKNRKEKIPMTTLSEISRERGCYVCKDLLSKIATYGFCPSERTINRIEPLVKELIEEKGLPFDDWQKDFKL